MRVAPFVAMALLAGCASTTAPYPVEVTRYRVDTVERGSVSIVPAAAGDIDPITLRAYEGALTDALTAQGYTVLPDGKRGAMVATVAVDSDRRESSRRSPVSIGLGGGTWGGGGVGLGGGVSFPIGRGKPREDVRTSLSVKIDKADGGGVWEGRAVTQSIRPVGTTDDALAARLVHGLFTGFPGDSGRTIEVK
jgi:hypothetical protein